MTTAADLATAITNLQTVVTDLTPQATSAANAASAQKLQSAKYQLQSQIIPWCQDLTTSVAGF